MYPHFLLLIIILVFPPFAFAQSTYTSSNLSSSYCPTLTQPMSKGSRDRTTNNQVSQLQRFLASHYGLATTDVVTGFFGTMTTTYVQRFQRENNLPPVGNVGPMTRIAITRACTSRTSVAPSTTPAPEPSGFQVLPGICPEVSVPDCSIPPTAIYLPNRCIERYECATAPVSSYGQSSYSTQSNYTAPNSSAPPAHQNSTQSVSPTSPYGLTRPTISDTAIHPTLSVLRDLLASVSRDNNQYRVRGMDVIFPGGTATPRSFASCSSLYDAVLYYTYGLSYRRFEELFGKNWNGADDYYRHIVAGKQFIRISTITEVKPGDLIAISYPSGSDSPGHTMVVNGTPSLASSTPSRRIYDVPIIDSIDVPHGADDSRSGNPPRTGLGSGTIRIAVDRDGHFEGYYWSRLPNAELRSITRFPFAIGRPTIE